MADLRSLDLNLLVIFQYLLEDGNLSAVARRLNLSQPAVSNALRRLRVTLEDELFVRTNDGMQPTPLAQRLAEPIGEALALLSQMLDVQDTFDPLSDGRRFRIAMSDVGEIHFMPVLIDYFAAAAPALRIDSVRMQGAALRREMEAGRVDLAVGVFEDLGSGFFQRQLFRQGYLTLYREGHPTADEGMSQEAFVRARHLIVSGAVPYGQVNQSLERAGIVISEHWSVPHFVAVPHILAENDLLATVPRKLAESVAARFGLRTLTPPIRIPRLQTNLFWPRRFHRDAANQWLRNLIVARFGD